MCNVVQLHTELSTFNSQHTLVSLKLRVMPPRMTSISRKFEPINIFGCYID